MGNRYTVTKLQTYIRKKYVTVGAVAKMMGTTPDIIHAMIERGELRDCKDEGDLCEWKRPIEKPRVRKWCRIPVEDVQKLMERYVIKLAEDVPLPKVNRRKLRRCREE
jgi:hypothetical protein